MAKRVQRDVYITINGTAVSDHANSCEITDEAAEVEFTAFGPAGYQEFGQGLKDATIAVTFFSDFASGSIHQMLQPLYANGSTFSIKVRPTSDSVSATNPEAQMTGRLYAYSGIAGGIGDAATFDCSIRNAATAGLVWATV